MALKKSKPKSAKGLVGAPNLTIRRAPIAASSSGDNTIVGATSGQRIVVTSLCLIATTAVTARFESGASGTALTGQMPLGDTGGIVLPHNEDGWFETVAGQLLNLELGGAVAVAGFINYRKLG
jgi:hypothetical protein